MSHPRRLRTRNPPVVETMARKPSTFNSKRSRGHRAAAPTSPASVPGGPQSHDCKHKSLAEQDVQLGQLPPVRASLTFARRLREDCANCG